MTGFPTANRFQRGVAVETAEELLRHHVDRAEHAQHLCVGQARNADQFHRQTFAAQAVDDRYQVLGALEPGLVGRVCDAQRAIAALAHTVEGNARGVDRPEVLFPMTRHVSAHVTHRQHRRGIPRHEVGIVAPALLVTDAVAPDLRALAAEIVLAERERTLPRTHVRAVGIYVQALVGPAQGRPARFR